MLTDAFYSALAVALRGGGDTAPAGFFIAVGSGDPAWDPSPPVMERGIARLAREIARLPVDPASIHHLDARGLETSAPSPRLNWRVTFDGDTAVGTWRECGLFGGPSQDSPLLAYYRHAPLVKSQGMTLERHIRLDLTPRGGAAAQTVTRFLGNAATREVHDLANPNTNCRIAAIRFDRQHYFASLEQAVLAGYDACAYCFGRTASLR